MLKAFSGFATAETKSFDVDIEDGILNIDFGQRLDDPKIAALEIERR